MPNIATQVGSCANSDIRKFEGLNHEVELTAISASTNPEVSYKHTNFSYTVGQEIRLVVLLPGELAKPIRCNVIHVNLENGPGYDAASYTWTTESDDVHLTGQIHCVHGGCISLITNCDAALCQLRYRGLRKRVWIDATCR